MPATHITTRTAVTAPNAPRRTRRRRARWLALIVSGAALSGAQIASAATFEVTSTANNGAGSLRHAIRDANATPGADSITFDISGPGPFVITPTTPLPAVTDTVTIDGYTQAGSLPATETDPAAIMVAVESASLAGLEIRTDGSLVRGLALMNVTALAGDSAALTVEGDGNTVAGNHLGFDAAGLAAAVGNRGVVVDGEANVIGGADPADRNIVTGDRLGIYVPSGGGNRVEGNWIGLDAWGGSGFGGTYGVQIDLSDDNAVVGNTISDWFVGMEVWGDRTVIQGNHVGTDPTGEKEIPNTLGINIEGGDESQIGGTGDGEGNLVSANPVGGIQLEWGEDDAPVGNILEGNVLGLDVTGTVEMPNGTTMALPALSLSGAEDTVVGGTVPGAANVISGNDGDGIRAVGDRNRILGNRIGTDRLGIRPFGNAGHGVSINGDDNVVGDGGGLLSRNVISHNGGDGVWVEDGTRNTILENVISVNGGLGIDLGPDGRSGEDNAPDADTGANDAQTPPRPTTAVAGVTQTPIQWVLDTIPSQLIRVDVYWSLACDPTGFGEGLLHLGTQEVTTNAGGHVRRTFTAGRLPVGSVVTLTATPLVGGVPTSTSEFSECKVVTN